MSDDTGPFCRHFDDPGDCTEECARCDHRCTDHSYDAPGECTVPDCKCTQWEEKAE